MTSSTTHLNSCSNQVAIEPTPSQNCYYHGEALASLERYEEALTSFNKAIELNPSYCEAWTFRGAVLFHLENYVGCYIAARKR